MNDPFTKLVQREAGRVRPRPRQPVESTFDPFDRSTFTGTEEEYQRLLWQWMRADPPSGAP